MSRRGNLNPRANIQSPPNWEPLSTAIFQSVLSGTTNCVAVPSGARAVLLTADVDMLVGLSTADGGITQSKGTYLNAGDHWPAMVMPSSTGSFKIRGPAGADGLATFHFLTHRTVGGEGF